VADHAISNDPIVQAQLDRLTMLSPGRDVLGLERIASLLERLGNPDQNLPPVAEQFAELSTMIGRCADWRSHRKAVRLSNTQIIKDPACAIRIGIRKILLHR